MITGPPGWQLSSLRRRMFPSSLIFQGGPDCLQKGGGNPPQTQQPNNLQVSGPELEGAGRSLRFRAGVTSREAAGSSVLRSDGLLQKGMAEP